MIEYFLCLYASDQDGEVDGGSVVLPVMMGIGFNVINIAIRRCAPDRSGGFLCMAELDGTPVLTVRCGNPPPAKKHLYLNCCQEKAQRLAIYRDHVLSAQSRDLTVCQYAGAVRCRHHILSFSGLPEYLDEAAMLVLGILAGELSEVEGRRHALITSNQFLEILLEECKRSPSCSSFFKK